MSTELLNKLVICREMGYTGSSKYNCCGHYGHGSGRIWTRGRLCRGHEDRYEQCSPGMWTSAGCYHNYDVGVTCEGYVFATWQDTRRSQLEIPVDIAPGQKHFIERLEIRDTSIIKVSAPTSVSRLSLSGSASLHISDELTITDHMVWRQGSIYGLSQMALLTVSGSAEFSWEKQVILSGIEAKLTQNVDIWAANALVLSNRATIKLEGMTRILSDKGSITYAGEAGGTVSITGSVEINGSLDIIANLLLTGYLKINNGGRLSFSECMVSDDGADYRGISQRSTTARDCQFWIYKNLYQYDSSRFPEQHVADLHNYCRLPNADNTLFGCFTQYRYESCPAVKKCGTVDIRGEVDVVEGGKLMMGGFTRVASSAQFKGNGAYVVSTGDIRIAAGLFQNQLLKVEWGNVTVTENSPKNIQVTGGLVKFQCQSVSCEGLTIKSLVVMGGRVEIYSELSIEKLELNGGVLATFSPLTLNDIIARNGRIQCSTNDEITVLDLLLTKGGYLSVDTCFITLSGHTVVQEVSTLEADSTIIKQTENGKFQVYSNAWIQAKSSTFQNFGMVEMKPSIDSTYSGAEIMLDVYLDNHGTVELKAHRTIFKNTFRNTGNFTSETDCHVFFEDGTLLCLGSNNLHVLGEITVGTSAFLEEISGFIDISTLHCLGKCTLYNGKVNNLTSAGVVTFTDRITETPFEVEHIFAEADSYVEIKNEIKLSSIFLQGGTVSISKTQSIETLSLKSGIIAGLGQLLTKYITLQINATIEISKLSVSCEKEFVLTSDLSTLANVITLTGGNIKLLSGARAALQGYIHVYGVGAIQNQGLMIFENSTRFHTAEDIEIHNTGTIRVNSNAKVSISLYNSGTLLSDKESVIAFNALTITSSSTFHSNGVMTAYGTSTIYSGNVTIRDINVSGASIVYYVSTLDDIIVHKINLNHGALSFTGSTSITSVRIDMVTLLEGTLDIGATAQINSLMQIGGALKITGNVSVEDLTLRGGVIQGIPGVGHLLATHMDVDGELTISLNSVKVTASQFFNWNSGLLSVLDLNENTKLFLNGTSTMNAMRTLTCQGAGQIWNNGNLTVEHTNGVNMPLTTYFANTIENKGRITFTNSGTVTFAGNIKNSGDIFTDQIDQLKLESSNSLVPLSITAKKVIISNGASVAISSSSSADELIIEEGSRVYLYPDDNDSEFIVRNLVIYGTLHTLSLVEAEHCLIKGSTIEGHHSSNVSLSCKELELVNTQESVNFEYLSVETSNITVRSHTTYLKNTNLHISSELNILQDINIIFSYNSNIVIGSACIASFWHRVHMTLSDISAGYVTNHGLINLYADAILDVPINNEGTVVVASSMHITFNQNAIAKTTTATFHLEPFAIVEFIGNGDLSFSSSSTISDFAIIEIKNGRIFIPNDIGIFKSTLSVSGGTLHLLSTIAPGTFDKTIIIVSSGHLSADSTVEISSFQLNGGTVNLTEASIGELTCLTGRLIGIDTTIGHLIVEGECQLVGGSFYITETCHIISSFPKVLKITEDAQVFFAKNSTSQLTGALLEGDNSGKVSFQGYLEVSDYVEVDKLLEVDVSGEIYGGGASSFQCEDSSTVIHQGAILSFPDGSLDVTATCSIEVKSSQFTFHSMKITGTIELLADTCCQSVYVAGGHANFTASNSISELILLSGTVSVTGDLSVNGPSLLGGGLMKVGAGANVYYNDAKEQRDSYTEENNGNVLNMESGGSCSAHHGSCSMCVVLTDCLWSSTSALCISKERVANQQCLTNFCLDETDVCSGLVSSTTCTVSTQCSWCYTAQACQLESQVCEEAENLTVWIGQNGDAWHDPTHWSTGQVPRDNDHVHILVDGVVNTNNADISVSSLTIGIPCKTKVAISNTRIAFNGYLVIEGDAYFNYGSIIDLNYHRSDISIGGKLHNTGTINIYGVRIIKIPEIHNYGVIQNKQHRHSTFIGEIYNYYRMIFEMQYPITLEGNITNMRNATIVMNTASFIYIGKIVNDGIINVHNAQETTRSYITSAVDQTSNGILHILRGQLQLQGTSRIAGSVHLKQNSKLYLTSQSFISDTRLTTMPTSNVILYGGTHNITSAEKIDGNLMIDNGATVVISKATNFSRVFLTNGNLVIESSDCHVDVLQLVRGTLTSEGNTIHVNNMIVDYYSRNNHVTVESTNIYIYNNITLSGDTGEVTYTKESNVTCMGCYMTVHYGQNAYFKTDGTASFANIDGVINIKGFTSFDIYLISMGSFNIHGHVVLRQNSIFTSGTLFAETQGEFIIRAAAEKCVIDKSVLLNILGVLHADSSLLITMDDNDVISELVSGSYSGFNGQINIVLEKTKNTTFQKVSCELGDITFNNTDYNHFLTLSLTNLYGGNLHLNSHVVIQECVVQTNREVRLYINQNFTYQIYRFKFDTGSYTMRMIGEGSIIHFMESFEMSNNKVLNIEDVSVTSGESFYCDGVIYTSVFTNIIGESNTFMEFESCTIYGNGNFDLQSTLLIFNSVLYTHLHISGAVIVNGNLDTRGSVFNYGQIQLRSTSKWRALAYFELKYDSTLWSDEESIFEVHHALIMNSSDVQINHLSLLGYQADIQIIEEPNHNITELHMTSYQCSLFLSPNVTLRINKVLITRGTFSGPGGTIIVDEISIQRLQPININDIHMVVTRNLTFGYNYGPVLHNAIIEIMQGAIVETSAQTITIYKSNSDVHGLINVKGILVVKPGLTFNVHTPIQIHGSAIIEGTLNMYGGGIFTESAISVNGYINVNSGSLLIDNATVDGSWRLGLLNGATDVLLNVAPHSDINMTIYYNGGLHNMEIIHADDYPGKLSVDGLRGTLNIRTTQKSYYSSINLDSSAILALEGNSFSTISTLQMNGNCMISFANRTSINEWIWGGGTVTESSDLIANNVVFTESTYNHQMRAANITVKNQLIFKDTFSLGLTNSRLVSHGVFLCYSDATINGDVFSSLYVGGELLLEKYTSSLTANTIRAELSGHIKLSQSTKLSLSELFSNGTITGESGLITVHDGVFTDSSGVNLTGILKTRGNVDIITSDIVVDKLYCLSGTTHIFPNSSIYIPDVYVYPDCKLLVNGYLNCNILWMKGGEIRGSGAISGEKVMWDGGMISIGEENSTSSGLFILHLNIYDTIGTTTAGGRIQIEEVGVMSEQSVLECQHNLTLINNGTLYFMQKSVAKNLAVGSTQRLYNYGVIYVDAGFHDEAVKLDIPILSIGNVTIRSGLFHLGMPDKTETSIFVGVVIVEKAAALTFSSGLYVFQGMSANLLMGQITGTNNAEIYMEDCTSGSKVKNVIMNGGVMTFTSETEDFIIDSIYIAGGNVSLDSVLRVEEINILSGFLFIRSDVTFGVTILNGGYIHSNKRQSKLTTDKIEWFASQISAAAGKRFPIETREIVMHQLHKRMENSVKLTILGHARYLSNAKLNLVNGAELIVSSQATLYFIYGQIEGSGSPNGILTNYGKIIFANTQLSVFDSYISCILNNYGLVNIQHMNVHFGNDAFLTGNGVDIDDKSKIFIEGGITQLTPDSISPPGGWIIIDGGELLLGPGNYSNYNKFIILSGYVSVQGTGNVESVLFDGMLDIKGGGLNISGVFIFNGTSTFSNGRIEGSGEVVVKNTATFDFVYGSTPSESRTVNCNLFSTEGDISVRSPLTVDSAGKIKVEENSNWHLQSYANLIGDGVFVNTGAINVEVHEEYECRPSVYIYNYRRIHVSDGKLDLTTERISMMESGIVEGPHVTLGDNVLSAGHISQDATISGSVQITENFIMINRIHWISGGFKSANNLCTTGYNPPIYSVIIPTCGVPLVFNRGYLQIETDVDKYFLPGVDFVNQGTIEWIAGKLAVWQMSFFNEEMGVVNITGLGDHIWEERQTNVIENRGIVTIQPYTSAVMGVSYFYNRAGGRISLSMGASIHIRRLFLYDDSIISSDFNTSTLSSDDLQVRGGKLLVSGSVKSPITAITGEINPAGVNHGSLDCDNLITLETESILRIDIYDAMTYDQVFAERVYLGSPQLILDWHDHIPQSNETYVLIRCTEQCYRTFSSVVNKPSNAIISYYFNSVELFLQ